MPHPKPNTLSFCSVLPLQQPPSALVAKPGPLKEASASLAPLLPLPSAAYAYVLACHKVVVCCFWHAPRGRERGFGGGKACTSGAWV